MDTGRGWFHFQDAKKGWQPVESYCPAHARKVGRVVLILIAWRIHVSPCRTDNQVKNRFYSSVRRAIRAGKDSDDSDADEDMEENGSIVAPSGAPNTTTNSATLRAVHRTPAHPREYSAHVRCSRCCCHTTWQHFDALHAKISSFPTPHSTNSAAAESPGKLPSHARWVLPHASSRTATSLPHAQPVSLPSTSRLVPP